MTITGIASGRSFSTTYIVQLFANPAADPSGYGQGQMLLGSFERQHR